MENITNEQLDSLIKSAVNSSGPLPPDEKFSQLISALRELRTHRNLINQREKISKSTNHPAHGPVSLERMHQIREILSKAAAQSDGGNLGYAMADAVKVIDGVIAAFGAEPVAVNDDMAYTFHHALSDSSLGADEVEEIKIGLRAAFANIATPQPAPRFIPPELTREEYRRRFMMEDNFDDTYRGGWNACRFAMLQGKPVSNRDALPLDYLQGHKDGLEWAAQLAEANHPQTGDWLYDDPIELAKAIRKGPDMPDGDGNSPVTPDCWCRTCRPVTMSDMRFVVCPDCGNKRCPHANDHRNACTGSNELGQIGSAYPAAPQQEVKNG